MNLDNIISTFPPEVRESPAMKGLVVLIQTYQEQLTKAHEKIQVLEDELAKLRKTPKRPKFRSNEMEPRNRNNNSQSPSGPTSPAAKSSLVQKPDNNINPSLP